MKQPHTALLIAALLTLALLSGCQQNLSQQWAASTRTYTATFTAVGDLYETGAISDEELLEIRRVRVPISVALDEIHDAIVAGDTDSAESALARTAGLLELAAAVIELASDEPP